MLIGHYAVGLAGTATTDRERLRPSLGTWFLAVQWLDLVWPVFVLAGLERVRVTDTLDPFLRLRFTYYPWSHSLIAALVWAALFGLVYRWRTGNRTAAWLLAAAVLSHWALDAIVHVPDLPLYPGGRFLVGLGVWHVPSATIILEGALFACGVAWYAKTTRSRDAVGRWGLWALVAFLVLAYGGSILGPPPPSSMAVAASALLLWLLVPWAYWIDKHRTVASK